MLDIGNEKLIPLTAIPALLTERGFRSRYGRPVAHRTVQGWAERGLLETTPASCGGQRHTTLEALERMLMSGESERETGGGKTPKRHRRRMTPRRQAERNAEIIAECESMGI